MLHLFFLFTCFANPVNVAVELSFELLLASKFEKGLSILHAFSLFGKFSESKKVKTFNKPDNIEANQAGAS